MPDTIVVVGASLAGGTAAAALREEGFDGTLVLIGEEPDLPYERPPLSRECLRGELPFEKALVRSAEFWTDNDVDLRLGARASRVDTASKEVELADGSRIRYDALLVATGGRNRRPPIPGIDLAGVHRLRPRAEGEATRGGASHGGNAVVVGMGFIGAEVAASRIASDS